MVCHNDKINAAAAAHRAREKKIEALWQKDLVLVERGEYERLAKIKRRLDELATRVKERGTNRPATGEDWFWHCLMTLSEWLADGAERWRRKKKKRMTKGSKLC